jgi:radical SAM superfamily enzyme YgiQ (UPF0313 family)
MRVLLVDNLLFEGSLARPLFDLQPHLGLMSLVAVLRQQSIEAAIFDAKRELAHGRLRLDNSLAKAVATLIADHGADVVGFTALGCNFPFVVRAAQWLKVLRPGRPILLGGPHATILHRQIMNRVDCFDVVVRHEAEHTLAPTLAALGGAQSLLTVPSITFRSPGRTLVETGSVGVVEELDDLPMPAYDAYPIATLGLDEIRIEAGRGCPFSCTFCSTATFFGRQYRLKSPERMLHEMDALHASYGFTAFKLNHDLFTVNRTKVRAFCEAVCGRGFEWSCSARVDCVDEELLADMKNAGCRQIYFGVETGSRRMQDISRKKLDLDLVEPTLAVTERLNIRTITSFIAGYPQETRADQNDTLDTVARLHLRPCGLNTGQLHLLTPEPGTALIEEFRNQLRFDEHVSEFSCPTLDDGAGDLVRDCPELFPNHHYFIGVLARARNVSVTSLWVTLHELGTKAMRQLLALYDGRLSRLAEDALAWSHRRHPPLDEMDLDGLLAFVSERFGADHAMTSTLRFAASRSYLLRLDSPREQAAGLAALDGAAITLSPYAVLLPKIHDMSWLMSAPDTEPAPPAAAWAGAREDRLMLRTARGLRYFALNDETAEWLASLPMQQPGAMPDDEDIKMLLGLGVLTTADARPDAP